MRFVLVDEARRRLAGKRDGVDTRAEIPEDHVDAIGRPPEDVLAVHRALERLAQIQPRYEKLVELRYFGGLSIEETAEALGVSRPTVVRDWQAAPDVALWRAPRLRRAARARLSRRRTFCRSARSFSKPRRSIRESGKPSSVR